MAEFNSANVLVGVGVLKVDGNSLGFTSGGVNLGVATDRVDKEVDQSFAPVGIIKVREQFNVVTNLAEVTLENLKLVWEQTAAITVDAGGGGNPPTRTLKWGINEDVIEHTLEFRGRSPKGFDRVFSVFKAVVFDVGDTPHVRDAITVIPVTFRILPDTAKPAGEEYGTIQDIEGVTIAGPAIGTEDAIPDVVAVVENVALTLI